MFNGQLGAFALNVCVCVCVCLFSLTPSFVSDTGSDGAEALAEMLKQNSSLQSLVLEGNDIGDGGAVALSNALQVNSTLLSLNICSCDIGVTGASAVANMLKTNTGLLRLNFSHNFVRPIFIVSRHNVIHHHTISIFSFYTLLFAV